jgi:hypothetical protein
LLLIFKVDSRVAEITAYIKGWENHVDRMDDVAEVARNCEPEECRVEEG